MVAVLEMDVAGKKQKPLREPLDGSMADGQEPDDDEDVQAILVASEISEWLVDIANYARRKAKKEKLIKGRKRIRVAVVVDPFLRQMVWELRQRCVNPGRAPGSPPPCTLRPLPVKIP